MAGPRTWGANPSGSFEYLVAAAPVRVQNRDAILTVPLTLRQQEIEAQIDELDRRVLLAAVLFIMLGAAIGYSMAERIADPVNRLMKATGRIARGDLDARILATSSDEFRRLVEAFNRMAADLQRQRVELERTNRLAAWADMARQVAHDIKNPLTPIQLNAEHLRRVHEDRGAPLGARARRVRATTSSRRCGCFARSPASSRALPRRRRPSGARRALHELIAEVVEPYRAGARGPRSHRDRRARFAAAADGRQKRAGARADQHHRERAARHARRRHAADRGRAFRTRVASSSRSPTRASAWTARRSSASSSPTSPRARSGTGLGLTIAKRNVELNGGTIAVRRAGRDDGTLTLRTDGAGVHHLRRQVRRRRR